MILTLTKDDFVNNMFTQVTDGGCIATFNCVQEHFKSGNIDGIVDAINIEISQEIEGIKYYESCPCVIGMGNAFIRIETDYIELLGSPITLDNIDKCYFNISDFSISSVLQ